MCQKIFFYVLFWGITQTVAGQTIVGKVVDEHRNPLPFSTVFLKHSRWGVASDNDGAFRFSLPANTPIHDTIVVRHIGYETVEKPITLLQQQFLDFQLIPSTETLAAVEISAEKNPLSAKKVVQTAIKNIKKNYPQTPTVQQGFYRELLQKNEITHRLNECVFLHESSRYPQKKLDKKVFRAYWDDYFLYRRQKVAMLGYFSLGWPTFIDENDRVKILESRIAHPETEAVSTPVKVGNPKGGPLDLLSLNTVKYQLHFLNKSLIKHYHFAFVGESTKNGEACYLISYRPKTLNTYRHQYNKKVSTALFEGKIWIQKKDFSVVQYTAESYDWLNTVVKAMSPNISTVHYPNTIHINVEFQHSHAGWVPYRIQHQTMNHVARGAPSEYVWTRTLTLSSPTKQVFDSTSGVLFPIRHLEIPDVTTQYRKKFWDTFTASDSLYFPLKRDQKKDLEARLPLDKQFEIVNRSVADLVPPATPVSGVFTEKSTRIKDSSVYELSLQAENEYAQKVLSKFSDLTRSFQPHRVIYNPTKEETFPLPKFRVQQDSNAHSWYAERVGAQYKNIVNLTQLPRTKNKTERPEIHCSENMAFVLLSSPHPLNKKLLIKSKNAPLFHDSISDVAELNVLNDSTFIFTRANHNRINQVFLKKQGEPEHLLWEENDPHFDIELVLSHSGNYVFIHMVSKDCAEIWSLDIQRLSLHKIISRQENLLGELHHFKGFTHFFGYHIGSNPHIYQVETDGSNRKHQVTTSGTPVQLYAHENQLAFVDYKQLSTTLFLVDLTTGNKKQIPTKTDIPCHEFDMEKSNGDTLYYTTESVNTPYSRYAFLLSTGEQKLVDQRKFIQQIKTLKPVVEQVYIKAQDGEKIPVLVSYCPQFLNDSSTALLVSGYGAYGQLVLPRFDAAVISLLENGFVVAFPGVRGTSAKGWQWYQQGKLLQKHHTFSDFMDVVRALQTTFNIPPARTFAKGVSAGGLLMGVLANHYGSEFRGIILDRAFLNPLEAMQDTTAYLTTGEYLEWGNPKDAKVHAYLKGYSPLDNVPQELHTNLFIRSSELDQRTPASQSMRYAQEFRDRNPHSYLILHKIRLGAKHMIPFNYLDALEEFGFMKYLMKNP